MKGTPLYSSMHWTNMETQQAGSSVDQ